MWKKLYGGGLESNKMKRNWKRTVIILKYSLQRGYTWCHLPVLAIIGAGVLKPYFPNISLWLLVLIALAIFIFVGVIDKKLKFLHEEQSYATEQNPTLMKGLFPEKDHK